MNARLFALATMLVMGQVDTTPRADGLIPQAHGGALLPPLGRGRDPHLRHMRDCPDPLNVLRAMLVEGPGADPVSRVLARGARAGRLRLMLARAIDAACRARERYVLDRHGVAHFAGMDPEPQRALEHILDRLLGKPRMSVEVEHRDYRPIDQARAELAQRLAAHPEVMALVAARMMLIAPPMVEEQSIDRMPTVDANPTAATVPDSPSGNSSAPRA